MTGRGLTVNVVVRRSGWLFDDIQDLLASTRVPGVDEVVPSVAPVGGADRWLYIRTAEAADTPDPARTVVQVHDVYREDRGGPMYIPGGTRGVVGLCGGVVLTHNDQVDILREQVEGGRHQWLLVRPIGARRYFALRGTMPRRLTIGWVGRDVGWMGRPVKRLVDLAGIVAGMRHKPVVVLVGKGFGDVPRRLLDAGAADVRVHDRADTPHREYPALYHGLDALVLTSTAEAGPLPLFEALACGVPVVSREAGWAPWLADHSSTMSPVQLYSGVHEAARLLDDLADERESWFADRRRMRATVEHWTMEGWAEECLELTTRVGGST